MPSNKRDKLEKFVTENRDAFDTFEPRADLWQDIERKLPGSSSGKVISFLPHQWWQYAAAVVLLITVGFSIGQFLRRPQTSETVAAVSLQKIAPEMAEVESYYATLIRQKRQELNAYDLKAMGITDNPQKDLAALDSAYARLKNELYTTPNKDRIINAMIQNLQIRMEVLNQQVQMLQRIQQTKNEKKDETIQT